MTCTFQNDALADEWLAWQKEMHLADVLAAGAQSAQVTRLDGSPPRIEVRYLFESREAFNTYEREHAPRLRNEGLKEFPLDRGLSYVRGVGTVVETQGEIDAT